MVFADLDEAKRARADHRLREAQEMWITTVRPDGQPQSSPVGFLWGGGRILILSDPASPKVRNLKRNPRIALHLDIDRTADGDGGVLTLEGVAALDPAPIGADEADTYAAKYAEAIRSAGLTREEAFAQLSAVIRVTPTRVRVY